VLRPVRATREVGRWLVPAAFALGCKTHTQPAPIADAPAAECPAYLDLELIGADSRFDPGWTGSTHGVGLPTGSQISVKIDECDAECRRCRFHGPVRGDPARTPVITQRCLKDVSRICTIDDDCKDPINHTDVGPCRFVFPPIAATAIVNTCALAYFEPVTGSDPSPVQGVIDLATGESDLRVLNILITLALQSCVNCLDDPMPFDGVPGGRCGTTTRACDVNGVGTAMASTTSYDCPPPPGQSTIVLGTNGTSTSSVGWTMDATTRPQCTTAAKPCWCGMCRTGTPCTSGKDCPDGFCGASQGPAPANIPWKVANNACMGTCNWDAATQHGTCSDKPTTPCFPDTDPMVATGFAEVHDGFYITQLANLVCMPSFSTGGGVSALVDVIGGFPGPFLFQSRFRVTPRSGQ
jgi:hypothetical protein